LEIDHCEFPDDIYLDVDNDVWLRISKDSAKMGVTSILSFLAGKLTSVKFRKANGGGLVTPQQTIATVESGKYFGPVRTPVSGKIARFNAELERDPGLINRSPYGEGWIAEFEMLNQDQLSALKRPTDARDAIQSRIRELKIRCFKALPDDEMFSIGSGCSTTLANLNQLLEKAPRGTVVHLVTDDPTADIEMIRWSDQTKNRVLETRREGNLYDFIIEKTGSV
jgi:glycine cleavage system H protein